MTSTPRIVALSGGVGGAKLAVGLSRVLSGNELAIVANTGDDFDHLGLRVTPDIDTLLYTLAGINNVETGWGRADETWSFMSSLAQVGAETWFQLGDKDLALNVHRTDQLRSGSTLSDIISKVASHFDIACRVIPMTDDRVSTVLETDHGVLDFQDYFVRLQCQPVVDRILFRGIDSAKPSPMFRDLLAGSALDAYVICPSNPYLSIDPILALPTVTEQLHESTTPVIAVSPIVSGESLKGPTGKIMDELDIPCTAMAVANHYDGLIDGIMIDTQDAEFADEISALGIQVKCCNIVMKSKREKVNLASDVLSFASELSH